MATSSQPEYNEAILTKAIKTTPKLELSHEGKRTTLMIPISSPQIDGSILKSALSIPGFTQKTELHVTVLDIKPGSDATKYFHGLKKNDQIIAMAILEEATSTTWEVRPQLELCVIEKKYPGENLPRRSVIQMVKCPDIIDLYSKLNLLSSGATKLEVPPTHITLATQNNPRGIGVATTKELRLLGRPVTLAATQ